MEILDSERTPHLIVQIRARVKFYEPYRIGFVVQRGMNEDGFIRRASDHFLWNECNCSWKLGLILSSGSESLRLWDNICAAWLWLWLRLRFGLDA